MPPSSASSTTWISTFDACLPGFLAGQGRFWLPGRGVAATVGSVGGALILYGFGAWLGEARLRRLLRRFGRFLRVQEDELDRAQQWFNRHGGMAVLLGRLVPVVRSLILIPAGLNRMLLGRFVLYTAIGSSLWNSAVVGLGWALGDRWDQVRRYGQVFEYLTLAVLAVLAVALAWFLWRRRHTHKPETA